MFSIDCCPDLQLAIAVQVDAGDFDRLGLTHLRIDTLQQAVCGG